MIGDDKLKFEQVMRGDAKVILLQGAIDEDAVLEPLGKLGNPLTFNFKGVESINSLGVRAWVNFIKSLSGVEVFYEECPPLVVRQMNMIPSFVGHAKVLSVYAPYICDQCDTESLVLVGQNQFKKIPESQPCEACKKSEMELDGHPQQYFAFQK